MSRALKIPVAWVISGEGINCERETAHALKLAGFEVQIRPLSDLIEERSRLLELLYQDPKPAGGCTPEAAWTNDGGFNAA